MGEPDPLLSISQACDYLGGIHRATLYREHKRKRLAFVKVRGATFVRRSELERYIRAATQAA